MRVSAELIRDPGAFERVAKERSEDVISRDAGGMLGGVRASQLANCDFLDVLATLKPGEISRPFQTPYGFHILKRYPPPPARQVTGERIVIGYTGAFGLVETSPRSREDALTLANEVAAQAKEMPGRFHELVERYSESEDRREHGDFGTYSTRDPAYLPVEVQRLSALMPGEVSGPVESRFGFEILKRVPNKRRRDYAMTAIEVVASANDGVANKLAAQKTAAAIADEV